MFRMRATPYLRDSYPFQNPVHAEMFHQGLALAGLVER